MKRREWIITCALVAVAMMVVGIAVGYGRGLSATSTQEQQLSRLGKETTALRSEVTYLKRAVDHEQSRVVSLQRTVSQEQERRRRAEGEVATLKATAAAARVATPSPPAAASWTPSAPSTSWTPPAYRIVKTRDVSGAGAVRFQYRVQLEGPATKAEFRAICEKMIGEAKRTRPHNALSILFFLPGTDTDGHYTAGMGEWAPAGDWGEAGAVETGDYSRHRLVLKVGNALGEPPDASDTGIPEEQRKRVFYELVDAQDRGVGDEQAYAVIAEKHGVPLDTVRKIAVEGALKGWPMPHPE